MGQRDQKCINAISYRRASVEPFSESDSNCFEESVSVRGLIKEDQPLSFPSVCYGRFPFSVALRTLAWRSRSSGPWRLNADLLVIT